MKHWILCAAVLAAQPVQAEETSARFSVRALGVKVGEFVMNGAVTQSRYTVASQFTTTGVIGSVSSVRFVLRATGRRSGADFRPQRYSEEMDTGQRQSRGELTYAGGVATASGTRAGDPGPYAVTRAQQRGAVDPLTGMFMVLRDQPRAGLCAVNQRLFDGERLTEIVMTGRSENGSEVTCTGVFRRLAGYAPDDLRRNSRFAVSVTYVPSGDLMQATRLQAQTVYGPATILRR